MGHIEKRDSFYYEINMKCKGFVAFILLIMTAMQPGC